MIAEILMHRENLCSCVVRWKRGTQQQYKESNFSFWVSLHDECDRATVTEKKEKITTHSFVRLPQLVAIAACVARCKCCSTPVIRAVRCHWLVCITKAPCALLGRSARDSTAASSVGHCSWNRKTKWNENQLEIMKRSMARVTATGQQMKYINARLEKEKAIMIRLNSVFVGSLTRSLARSIRSSACVNQKKNTSASNRIDTQKKIWMEHEDESCRKRNIKKANSVDDDWRLNFFLSCTMGFSTITQWSDLCFIDK